MDHIREHTIDGATSKKPGSALVDAFAHFLPVEFRDALQERCDVSRPELLNWRGFKGLTDIHYRIGMLDEEGIESQVLTTPTPSLECIFSPTDASQLARIANDSMKRTIDEYPHRLLGVATVSLLSVDGAIKELERATADLGLSGVLAYTNVNGRPLDNSEMRDFFDAVKDLDIPMWLHPDRLPSLSDYPTEAASRYDLFLMFGLPYDTTIAMTRLVFSGVFDRDPGLRILAHHAGGMIPFFAERAGLHFDHEATQQRLGAEVANFATRMKSFHVDAMTSGSSSALRTAYDFFGPERLMFASDMPFGPSEGRVFVRRCRKAIEELPIPEPEKQLIFRENALRFAAGSSRSAT